MQAASLEPRPNDAEQVNGQRKERGRRAKLTTLTALAGRGLGILVSIISVPLTVGYLDTERYGLWITIGSFFGWLQIADLGLGNGLTNLLAQERAQSNDSGARVAITSTIVMLSAVSALLLLLLLTAIPFAPWGRVFGTSTRISEDEVRLALLICACVFAVGFPLGIVDKIYAGLQEGFVLNYWNIASNVTSVVALIAAVRFGRGLPLLVIALWVVPAVVRVASAAELFFRRHPELKPALADARVKTMKALWNSGSQFFVAQLAAVAMWQNDNIVISQLFGAGAVGPYSLAFRLASTYLALANIWLGPLWPAYADAAARQDFVWIRGTVRRSTILATVASTIVGAGIVVLGKFVIVLWARSAAMAPDRALLFPVGALVPIYVFCNSQAMALNGLGRLRGQMFYGMAAAVLNVGLSIILGRNFGIAGVCWATVIAALLPAFLAARELRLFLSSTNLKSASKRRSP
jgi:O-antigen/teichoic acid export membrane protein